MSEKTPATAERQTADRKATAALRGARAGFIVAMVYGALATLAIFPSQPEGLLDLLRIILRTAGLTLVIVPLFGGLPGLVVGALTGYAIAALLGHRSHPASALGAGLTGAGVALLGIMLTHLVGARSGSQLATLSYLTFLGLPSAIYLALSSYAAVKLWREQQATK